MFPKACCIFMQPQSLYLWLFITICWSYKKKTCKLSIQYVRTTVLSECVRRQIDTYKLKTQTKGTYQTGL